MLDKLSPRERQVAEMIHQGKRNKEIQAALGIAQGTVHTYMRGCFLKFGVPNRVQLAIAIEREKAAAK